MSHLVPHVYPGQGRGGTGERWDTDCTVRSLASELRLLTLLTLFGRAETGYVRLPVPSSCVPSSLNELVEP